MPDISSSLVAISPSFGRHYTTPHSHLVSATCQYLNPLARSHSQCAQRPTPKDDRLVRISHQYRATGRTLCITSRHPDACFCCYHAGGENVREFLLLASRLCKLFQFTALHRRNGHYGGTRKSEMSGRHKECERRREQCGLRDRCVARSRTPGHFTAMPTAAEPGWRRNAAR